MSVWKRFRSGRFAAESGREFRLPRSQLSENDSLSALRSTSGPSFDLWHATDPTGRGSNGDWHRKAAIRCCSLRHIAWPP